MHAIFIRGDKYLNWRFKWVDIPDLFPEWHFPVVRDMARNWKDRPDGYAFVKPGIIDLDALDVIEL